MEQYSKPLKVFISYSHKNAGEKEEIVRSLMQTSSQYEILSDDLLNPADNWDMVLTKLRSEADVFLLLVSQFYLDSSTIPTVELPQIMKRGEDGSAYIIPVILEACPWSDRPFAKFQALPKFGKPANTFTNKEAVYQQINEALDALYYLLLNGQALDLIKQCKLHQNTILDLSGCNLYSIPRDLLKMPWLVNLHLQKNALRKIDNLDELSNLEYLDLSDNEITEIQNLDKLTKLQYLDLEKNRVSEIKNLENNKALKTLGVSTNNIEQLSGIAHLLQLETFYAARNKIKDVSVLAQLPALTRIVLTDNIISSIRSLLPLMKKGTAVELKYALKKDEPGIFVKGNPISDPPLEVIAMGATAILDHFTKGEKHGEKKLEVLKLILMGNSGVGKTNFSQFLRKQRLSQKHISTDSLDIQSWKPPFLKMENGDPMLVNIFDFGGQDYYHDLHRLYYSHDTAYVLLWDTSTNFYAERKEQLADNTELVYEDFPIEYWLESIKYVLYGKEAYDYNNKPAVTNISSGNIAPKTPEDATVITEEKSIVQADLSTTAPVLVLQNKIDEGEGLLNQVMLRQTYPNITTFFNVSLSKKSRVTSIYEVMDACLSKLNLSGRKLISYQHEIIEKYLQSNIDFEVLPLSAFKEKCTALLPSYKDVLDISDAKTIASVLTNLGILYFDQSSAADSAEGIVFTRIDQLNELIKKIMNKAKLGSDKGVFTKSSLSDIKHAEHLLPLLTRNKSIISLPDDRFLVPQFLPVTAEPQVAAFTEAFVHCQIRYVYTAYFHKLLLMSLFAKFLGNRTGDVENTNPIKSIHYWRNGLILSQETNGRPQMVFIKFLKERTACRIEIRTLYPFERNGLEREIEKELDELNKGWSFSKEVSVNSKDFFEVQQMIKQVKAGDFIFRGANKTFTVNDFKHLVNFEKVPRKLFISYSSKNSDFVKRFWTHLDVLRTAGYIEPWYDRKIEPGAKWDDSIQQQMLSSDLVIFLLSPDFLATPYIMEEEVKNAMKMEDNKQCELFFIQLLHCGWGETDLKKYQMMFDPGQADKKEFFIGSPGNDEAWKTILNILKDKVKA